jgi:DNA (cytosine-5)-methyltransferase 1
MGIVAFDLFCGCGGVTHGLSRAGIRVAVGVDINPDCRMTYKLNNPGSKFIASDLRKVTGRDLLNAWGKETKGEHLMLAACAPCQPFSPSRQTEVRTSERTILQEVGRLVRDLRPDFLFLENVPGMARVNGFSSFRRLLHTMDSMNYRTIFKILDAQSYGVPQTRKRLVLLASRGVSICWPEATHGADPGLKPVRTVRDAICKFPALRAGDMHPTIPNHITASIAEHNINRLRATPPNGGSRADWPRELTLACHETHSGHGDVYGRLNWDRPAPTLTTKCTSISNGRYGHPEQDRAISVREAAALQSFDDSYVFYGNLQETTRQVGNSVPPIVAEQFGRACLNALEKLELKKRKRAS